MNRGLADSEWIDDLLALVRAPAERDRLWHPVERPRGVELMAQGNAVAPIFVMLRGLVKLSYATADGGERIKSFIADRGVFGPGLDDVEGRYAATTIEPSTTVALPIGWINARIAENGDLAKAHARFEAWLRARKEARELALLCDSAEQRYRDFLRHEPELTARLPQGDIARFIGVTPIAFSRIKRRMIR